MVGQQSRNLQDNLPIPGLERLQQVFRQYPGVRAVYLFGSVADGHARPDSDLDLAVVPASGSVRERQLDILTDLARAGFCDVDLVFLDTDDIVLQYEAVRQNVLVYQTDEFDHGEMYSRVIRQYFDFLPYLEVQREAYKRRILLGQNGSDPQETQQAGREEPALRRFP